MSLLIEYAEGLVDRTARLDPVVASHVSGCLVCRSCVDEMRGSLRVVDDLEVIEPCGDLAASILLAAKQTRVMPARRRGRSIALGGLALAAGVLLVEGLAMDGPSTTSVDFVESSFAEEVAVIQAEIVPVVSEWSSQVEAVLSNAVMGSHREPSDDWELAQRRKVRVLESDIAEGELALASNPGFLRASYVVMSNREQKARTLRNVYIESR